MSTMIRFWMAFSCMLAATLGALPESRENLGFRLTVQNVEFASAFGGLNPEEGSQWLVIDLEIRNSIDPFLVFDHEVEEQIAILRIEDRLFLLDESGSSYRLREELWGQAEHLGPSIILRSAGHTVRGKLAFQVPDGSDRDYTLLLVDEQFASLSVPVRGEPFEVGLPEGLKLQSNDAVELAVGKHGFVESVEGMRPADGFRWYEVDLWGRSKWSREVSAYFHDINASRSSRVANGFFFDYLHSGLLLNLVVEESHAIRFRDDMRSGQRNLFFLPDSWTRHQLVFEIPEGSERIGLVAQFGKMGLLGGAVEYLEALSFTLRDGPARDLRPESIQFVDRSKDQELTLALALVEDVSPWGVVSSEDYFGLHVSLINTGSEPGAIEAGHRFWFSGDQDVRTVSEQIQNPYAPRGQLFLDLQQRRDFLLLFKAQAFKDSGVKELNYSGIGVHARFPVDASSMALASPIQPPMGQHPSPQSPTRVETTRGESLDETVRQLPIPTDTTQSFEEDVSAAGDSVPQMDQWTLTYTFMDPEPYHDRALALSAATLEEMAKEAFPLIPDYNFDRIEQVFRATVAREVEPNNTRAEASPYAVGQVADAVMEVGGEDYWSFEIPEGTSANDLYDLHIASAADEEGLNGFWFYLQDERGEQLLNRRVRSPEYSIRLLKIEPGRYFLRIQHIRNTPESRYRFILQPVADQRRLAYEPNDSIANAIELPLNAMVSGSLNIGDRDDYFRLDFSDKDAKQRYEILLLADDPEAVLELRLYEENRNRISRRRGQGSLVLEDLSPDEGSYWLSVNGPGDAMIHYHLKVENRGEHPHGWEREPNDNISRAGLSVIESIRPDAPDLLGRLTTGDSDCFGLNVVEGEALYTITLNASGSPRLEYQDNRGRTIARSSQGGDDQGAVLPVLRLPLGLNVFQISGFEGDYAVNVEKLPVPEGNYAWEPNDTENTAQLMHLGVTYAGHLLHRMDRDWFRFVVHQAMDYELYFDSGEGASHTLFLAGAGKRFPQRATSLEQQIHTEPHFLLPGSYTIQVRPQVPGSELYHIRVTPVAPYEQTASTNGVEVEVLNPQLVVGAFAEVFQQATQKLRVKNLSETKVTLEMAALAAHHRVRPHESTPRQIVLDAGGQKEMELHWLVEPLLATSESTQLYVTLTTPDGERIGGTSELAIAADVLPVQPLPGRSLLNDKLAGGLNLNALALGSEAVLEPVTLYPDGNVPRPNQIETLIDGVLSLRSFVGSSAVVRMAGDGTEPIIGTTIDLHGRRSLWESAKAFSVDISQDGIQFQEILKAELEPRKGEQVFLFPEPVRGKYSRIRLHSTHDGQEGGEIHLGQWRMIAQPDRNVASLGEFDLLRQDLGGHRIHEGETYAVYGFHHNRAARIRALRWENTRASIGNRMNVQQLRIETSMDSPVGPWDALVEFDISSADGEALEFEAGLEDEPWARFVRFSWEIPEGARHVNTPRSISLYEKVMGEDYRSILGEWGDDHKEAYLEFLERKNASEEKIVFERVKSTRDQPYALPFDTWVSSVAWINEGWEDWYVIDPIPVPKRLQFTVEGKPFVKVAVRVYDAQGNEVAVRQQDVSGAQRQFIFSAAANQRYSVHVFEPKRSIVYLWDVSGSMGTFVPSIENAVLKFAQEIDPETEKVQLLPFDEPPRFLLEYWSSDSFLLQHTVRNYSAPISSYAHLNLLEATRLLGEEEGTRAAIVITDCESSRAVNALLWQALEEVRPAIFTFLTSALTANYRQEQDDMQDWASVGGGFYHTTRANHELDFAFERVQAYLRRPAPYSIKLTAPEVRPSYIQVTDGRDASAVREPGQDGVLLIIDASASMRELMPDGEMRINTAKRVIQSLVDAYLPDDIQFGMRVLGHRGGVNCESELLVPMAPMDRNLIRQKLLTLRSSSLGNTGLAEALGWAPEDLQGVHGDKRVILLTDGEETCRGTPADVIAQLAASGLDVIVNVVGFNMEGGEELRQRYANWVKVTGGRYFDSKDDETLGKALQDAMTPQTLPMFQILDSFGAVVATGQVGDAAIEVESGWYTVVIQYPENPTSHEIEAFETTVTLPHP